MKGSSILGSKTDVKIKQSPKKKSIKLKSKTKEKVQGALSKIKNTETKSLSLMLDPELQDIENRLLMKIKDSGSVSAFEHRSSIIDARPTPIHTDPFKTKRHSQATELLAPKSESQMGSVGGLPSLC